MSNRPVPLPEGDAETRRIRSVLVERARGACGRFEDALPRCDEARRFWSERAWSEYAAVPAISQTVLALVREGGSMDELGALTQISADEVRHTELSRDLADAFGGYVEEIPSGLSYAPALLADPSAATFAQWVVGNGCVSETLSFELMAARLKHTHHPLVSCVLTRVLQDEAVHARTSWMIAERLLPTLSEFDREVLGDYVLELVEAIRKTFVTARLPPAIRAEARRIREVTASLGFGACPPDEADARVEQKLAELVLPRLRALGLSSLPT